MSDTNASPLGNAFTLLAGIRADETALIAFPSACSRRSVAIDEYWTKARRYDLNPFVLPLRGQRRLRVLARLSANSLLLPVELRHVNHTASTNIRDSTLWLVSKPYN